MVCRLWDDEVSQLWRQPLGSPPGTACPCASYCHTGYRPYGAAGHRPASKPSYRPGSYLPHRYSGQISRFSRSMFSDMVCCLLSNDVSRLHSTRDLETMSLFICFSICETYSTLLSEKVQSLALPAKELTEQVIDRPASSIVRSREFAFQFASQLDGLT